MSYLNVNTYHNSLHCVLACSYDVNDMWKQEWSCWECKKVELKKSNMIKILMIDFTVRTSDLYVRQEGLLGYKNFNVMILFEYYLIKTW